MPDRTQYDIVIAGLGAMGSAAAFHIARAGRRVLGLDRYTPPHALGSSHGQTRIIREAYFEHPAYVPLVQRAYELWADLAGAAHAELFLPTGGLMIGTPESTVFRGAMTSAKNHRLAHEVLSARQVRDRFPGLAPADDMSAVWEPRAGILFPERCVEAHLNLARRLGADLRFDEPLEQWQADGQSVRVRTPRGSFTAGRLILCAGAWMRSLLGDLQPPLRVERQVLYWFEPPSQREIFQPARCPIHLWQYDGEHFFYGFPDLGHGVKVARHHDGEETNPDEVRREVDATEQEAMRQVVRRFLPQADGAIRSATVCLYTNTPDSHFWIDRHLEHAQVIVASPCSGHGFKFSSAVGEILAELAQDGRSRFDLALFRHRWPVGKKS